MTLYAVDGRDGVAQRVTDSYDAADGIRFHKIEAATAAEAIEIGRAITERIRSESTRRLFLATRRSYF